MTKKSIIITSIITVGVGSIAFYFLYWRKRNGVSENDKSMLEQATVVQENTSVNSLPTLTPDEYGDLDLKASKVQGPVKIL